jgi:hypothetical protein
LSKFYKLTQDSFKKDRCVNCIFTKELIYEVEYDNDNKIHFTCRKSINQFNKKSPILRWNISKEVSCHCIAENKTKDIEVDEDSAELLVALL